MNKKKGVFFFSMAPLSVRASASLTEDMGPFYDAPESGFEKKLWRTNLVQLERLSLMTSAVVF